MNAIALALALVSVHAAPSVIRTHEVVITVPSRARAWKCGEWYALQQGAGMVRDCQ